MRALLFAASVTLGAWWLQHQAELPALGYALLVVPLGALAWQLGKIQSPAGRATQTLCWLLVCVLIGFYWAATHARVRMASHLGEVWRGRDVRIEGVRVIGNGQHGILERVRTIGARVPGRVSLTWYASWSGDRTHIPELLAGQRWQFTVRLQPPHGSFNPHGFNIEAKMLERGIRATGYIRDGPSAKRLSAMVWKPAYIVERARERIRHSLQSLTRNKPYSEAFNIATTMGRFHAYRCQPFNEHIRSAHHDVVWFGIRHRITPLASVCVSGYTHVTATRRHSRRIDDGSELRGAFRVRHSSAAHRIHVVCGRIRAMERMALAGPGNSRCGIIIGRCARSHGG